MWGENCFILSLSLRGIKTRLEVEERTGQGEMSGDRDTEAGQEGYVRKCPVVLIILFLFHVL